MSAIVASSSSRRMSAAERPSPPCACRGERQSAARSRVRPRRAASTKPRCRARRRPPRRRRDVSRPDRVRQSAPPQARGGRLTKLSAPRRHEWPRGRDQAQSRARHGREAPGNSPLPQRCHRHKGRRREARAPRSASVSRTGIWPSPPGAAGLITRRPAARARRALHAGAGPAPAPVRDGSGSASAPRSGTCALARQTPPRNQAPTPS